MNAPTEGVKPLKSIESILQKTIGNMIINGFVEVKPVTFTVDMGTTVPVSYTHLDVYKRQGGN